MRVASESGQTWLAWAPSTVNSWRLDRLGRSLAHPVSLVTELGERGVGFVSMTEAIDTTTPAGRLLFGVMASLAQFERDVIGERTVAGLTAARARGRVGGRPAIMTPDKLAVARQMLADGKSKTVVAKTIGVSRPTLYTHLAGGREQLIRRRRPTSSGVATADCAPPNAATS